MRKCMLFFVAICMFQIGFAQNTNQEVDIVSHTVQLGETVRMLSKKYMVDPSEIYHLNKFAVNGISQGMVLQIPVPRKEAPSEQQELQENTETVTQNDKKYEAPPAQSEPVKKPKATTAKPVSSESSITVINRDSQIEHTVESGETLYSLSRKYGVSVDEIKMSNEEAIKKGLKVGQVVKIPSTKSIDSTASSIGSTVTPTREVTQNKSTVIVSEPKQTEAVSAEAGNSGMVTHKVEPKETLYSLSKRYNVTVDDIKAENPDVAKHGLQVGQTLTIRKN